MNEKKIIMEILETLDLPETFQKQALTTKIMQDNKKSLFEKTSSIITAYIKENITQFQLDMPTIEGESKKIYVWNKFALIELKPTMYSFTHNRYGVVEGTDDIRVKFWKYFGKKLNTYVSDYLIGKNPEQFREQLDTLFLTNIISERYPFISSYLGEIKNEGKSYVITRFVDTLPPIEVVWKNYLVGTMKHNLKQVDKFFTTKGKLITYEGKFPKDIIRFDWRNPLPDKDEALPDEFAAFYLDTENARKVIRLSSHMLNFILQKKGYELIDLCYFINHDGNMIFSEITPDGMRIRKTGKSFDKDLWRAGKDKDTINTVWNELYTDLTSET